MKERIYTIPINEAFDKGTECPLCVCEDKLEDDALRYTTGPAMMEPDTRIETNKKGFCKDHYTKLCNLEQNKLPLALVIDTHLAEQIEALAGIYNKHEVDIIKESEKSAIRSAIDTLTGKKKVAGKAVSELAEKLESLEKTCFVCDRLDANMERLIENVLYLYEKEPEFREKFKNSKGFCLKHFKLLLIKASEEFSGPKQAEFLLDLIPTQLEALKRVQEDVNYFTKMFDYRNQNADWKNSRDAVPRSIEKICGTCQLKR